MTRPLDDITVIEIDNWMAAPSAGAILCDLGARVIKVEPLGGDPLRNTCREIALEGPLAKHDYKFDVDNRGKESICLDLRQAEGQALVRALCEQAEVFLCNLLPDRQAKYGLDPATLFKAKPKLVHATLTGYGTTGPEAWRAGYDTTAFFARSGLLDTMREGPERTPAWPARAQGDHAAGLALVSAILAGLRMVERTGEGQTVETSLLETAVWTQASEYGPTLADGAPLPVRAHDEPPILTQNLYSCKDGGAILFNMLEPAWWEPFCKMLNQPDWIDQYPTPEDRLQARKQLVPAIDAIMAQKTAEEWSAICDELNFRWAPVLGIHELAEDPQAEAIGLFPEINAPGVGVYRSVRAPFRIHDTDLNPRSPSPDLGAQGENILRRLGKTETDIEGLRQNKITR